VDEAAARIREAGRNPEENTAPAEED